jgi:uncharacterized protein (TIGR02145 family)
LKSLNSNIIIIFFLLIVPTCFTACRKDDLKSKAPSTLTDIDGNTYDVIVIEKQVWMAENLKTTKYNDGTPIRFVSDASTWSKLTVPAYTYYNNDSITYKDTYGALYNWYTVKSAKLCPTGWHVPTDIEWSIAINSQGGENVAGIKLKEPGAAHWLSPVSEATNESGFTALPGGYRHFNGPFYQIGYNGFWWSSSDYYSLYAWFRSMFSYYTYVYHDFYLKGYGFSVRCIMDE